MPKKKDEQDKQNQAQGNQGQEQGQNTQLAKPSPLATIRDMMVAKKNQFAVALPKLIDPARFMRVVMTTIKADGNLLDCTPDSLFRAVLASAQVGLEPDPVLGHAYLIPFWNNKRGVREAQFLIGYKGLIELARRSGQVISISAQVVYDADEFEFNYGLESDTLSHKPKLGNEDRGAPKAVWAKAVLKDGGRAFEVMSVADVEKIRKMSKAGDFGPWKDHWDEMARKTAVRKLAKYLPLSPEFQRAAAIDEALELGHSADQIFAELEVLDDEQSDQTEQGAVESTGTQGKLDDLKNKAAAVKGSQTPEDGATPETGPEAAKE